MPSLRTGSVAASRNTNDEASGPESCDDVVDTVAASTSPAAEPQPAATVVVTSASAIAVAATRAVACAPRGWAPAGRGRIGRIIAANARTVRGHAGSPEVIGSG